MLGLEILDRVPKSHVFLFKIGVSVGLAVGLFKIFKHLKRQAKYKKFPKDVVIFHHFGPGLRAPSVSPFPLKLETW